MATLNFRVSDIWGVFARRRFATATMAAWVHRTMTGGVSNEDTCPLPSFWPLFLPSNPPYIHPNVCLSVCLFVCYCMSFLRLVYSQFSFCICKDNNFIYHLPFATGVHKGYSHFQIIFMGSKCVYLIGLWCGSGPGPCSKYFVSSPAKAIISCW